MSKVPSAKCQIEVLEARIAPAAVTIYGLHKATFVDPAGHLAAVTVSAGTLSVSDFITTASGAGFQLQELNLSSTGFSGSTVVISAVGGLENVGYIDGGTNSFGSITVKGDLSALVAGNNSATTPAVKALNTDSIGIYGTATGGNLVLSIDGELGALNVAHDFIDAALQASGTNGSIGSIKLGGSFIGHGTNNGLIVSATGIGNIVIQDNIVGGSGDDSGFIDAETASIGNVTVGGSVLGGSGEYSGAIYANGSMGAVTIGHSLVGGSANNAGAILALQGKLASATVKGDIIGGAGEYSGILYGFIATNATSLCIGPVTIGGNLIGGSGQNSGCVFGSGGSVGAVTVAGSVIGAQGKSSGNVYASYNLGPVNVGSNLTGGSGDESGMIYAAAYNGIIYSGTVASVQIGGSVFGGSGILSGAIYSYDNLGSVKIAGGVTGGDGSNSGSVGAHYGNLASVKLGGNLSGGGGEYSGSVIVASMSGAASIRGSIVGGDGQSSGEVYAATGSLGSVSVAKNIVGGQGGFSGAVGASLNLQSVVVGGDLVGASFSGSSTLSVTGAIYAQGHIGSVLIKGSIISGSNGGSGSLNQSGAIFSDTADIASITVVRDIIGNATEPVQISAVGKATAPSSGTDNAIGSVIVDGSVSWCGFYAGFTNGLSSANANASIASIIVKGNWTASNAIAGASAGNSPYWGVGDSLQSGGNPNLTAEIGKVTIGGTLTGIAASGPTFGFVAHAFTSIKVGGDSINLTPGLISEALNGEVYLETV
jgi:hypothetical protein